MQQRFRFVSLLSLAGLVFLLAGCGKKTATVKGTLVLPPGVTLAKEDAVQIGFIPEAGGAGKAATFDNNGLSFTAAGVPVGKNKVTVTITPYLGAPGNEKRTEYFKSTINDLFGAGSTPLTYDVKGSPPEQTIAIDLATKTVTAK